MIEKTIEALVETASRNLGIAEMNVRETERLRQLDKDLAKLANKVVKVEFTYEQEGKLYLAWFNTPEICAEASRAAQEAGKIEVQNCLESLERKIGKESCEKESK